MPATEHPRNKIVAVALLSLLASHVSPLSSQSLAAHADSLMRAFVAPDAPGCAVAIDTSGVRAFTAGYGLAELEYQIPISDSTIFEAGSVSKQFVAAAVLLLDARGTLSLDDTLQKWFPEIPVYEAPITIRHLMLHTSGLRDWGSVRGLAGWPRWTASYTHDDALQIIARQRGLNHRPGEAYSYTNTGYNLMVMLVERATHQRFTTFTAREFFEPLGMRHTSWRDDYRRIVPGRAQAYGRSAGQWRLDMPFEHVFGNGGLLTTVGDLLTWNQALTDGRIGSPDVSRAMQTSGVFNDGRPVGYGGGLQIGAIRGQRAISHGGSTAGYRTALARFPDASVSIAILCNRSNANPVAMIPDLLAVTVQFEPAPPRPRQTQPQPATIAFNPADYLGEWYSDEVDGTLTLSVRQGRLMVERRPGDAAPMVATAPDTFEGPGSLELVFSRDTKGKVTDLKASVSRALGVPYRRR